LDRSVPPENGDEARGFSLPCGVLWASAERGCAVSTA